MENQPDNRIINLTSLDLFLELVPDEHARRHIRDQVFFAAQAVEKKDDEVTRLKAEAEAIYAQVQEQKGELEAKQNALADEQARLNAIADKACTLPDRVDGLARQVNQVSSSFTKDSKTLVDKLDAVQNISEKSRQAIKGDITELSDKVDAGQSSAQDLSAELLRIIKDDIAGRITWLCETALSSGKSDKDEITKVIDSAVSGIEQKLKSEMGNVTKSLADAAANQQKLTTYMGNVAKDVAASTADQQKLKTEMGNVNKSLAASVADQVQIFDTLAGREGIVAQLQPLAARLEAMEKSIGSLPSKADLPQALEAAGSYRHFNEYADLLEKYRKVAQERDQSRLESQSLRAEMDNLKEKAAIDVRAVRSQEALANERLEGERQRVQRRDNTIQDLQDTCDATYQQLQEAQGSLGDFAGLQQQLQDTRARLEAAETAAQELQQTRDQLRRSEEAESRYSREIVRQRASIEQEKKLNKERSQQISEMGDHLADAKAGRQQAEQARIKAEEMAAQLQTCFQEQGAFQQELKEAWANEKALLQEKVSNRDSLLSDQERDLVSLRSGVAEIERLQKQLDDAQVQVERLEGLLNVASHKAETYSQQLSEARTGKQDLTTALATSNSKLEDARRLANGLEQSLRDTQSAFEGRLEESSHKAETYSQHLSAARRGEQDLKTALATSNSKLDDTRRLVSELEQRLNDAQSRISTLEGLLKEASRKADKCSQQLSVARSGEQDLKAALATSNSKLEDARSLISGLEERLSDAQSRINTFEDQTSMPQGILSGLAEMYVKLAREFQDIPTAPANIHSFDMTEVAVEIAPLLAQYEAKDNLLAFLNAQTPDWHCLQQVVDGDPSSVVQDQCGQHLGSCVLVRVITLGTAVLEFKTTSN